MVDKLASTGAIPIEVVQFSWRHIAHRILHLTSLGPNVEVRLRTSSDGSPFITENGNYVLDIYCKV